MHSPDHIAAQLIAQLEARGLPADRYTAGPGSARVNVWAPPAAITAEDPHLDRYPQVSVLVSDAGKFHDVSWGANWEHALPLNTPAADIAAAVFKTLPAAVTRVLDERK